MLKRSSADDEKPAWRDIIWGQEKYRQLVGHSTTVLYAEGVLTYRQADGLYSTAIAQHFYQTESPPEWQALPPIRISQPYYGIRKP